MSEYIRNQIVELRHDVPIALDQANFNSEAIENAPDIIEALLDGLIEIRDSNKDDAINLRAMAFRTINTAQTGQEHSDV